MKIILGLFTALLLTSVSFAIAPSTDSITPEERINVSCEIYTSDAIAAIKSNEFSSFKEIEGNSLERYDIIYSFTDKTNSVLIMLVSKDSCVIDIYVIER